MTKWDRISIAYIAMVTAGGDLPRPAEIVSVFDLVTGLISLLFFVTLTGRLVFLSWQPDERDV